ncbi:MAG TPA: XdhC family protein [Thermoanaerobaculia bacterium]|jgi:xanthine/CO dehydrogenase XdhC/CoxF family maturation factor|nr:XdhC family protein [Thermoanaerobaculia bacterium]
MSHWGETAGILSRLARLAGEGQRAALATVVRISGSAYRRPGAKLLVEESGGTLGGVSGGCLEADVREIAREVLESGVPRLRRYDMRGDEDVLWGLNLGCRGEVDVFVQPATEGQFAAVAAPLSDLLAADAPFALATVIEGSEAGALRIVVRTGEDPNDETLGFAELYSRVTEAARRLLGRGDSTVRTFGEQRVFFELLRPPPHLVVCGAGDDAQPLVAYAAEAGFRVTVIDHRQALLEPSRFPRAAVLIEARPDEEAAGDVLPVADHALAVVKTHSLTHDREWTRRLLAAGFPYVGLLGPRARTETILLDIDAEHDPRIFGPVGLDLGAEGAHQIAISIVAELLAFHSHREPLHLRRRTEAIHVA